MEYLASGAESVETFTKEEGTEALISSLLVGMHLLMTSTVGTKMGKQGPLPGMVLMLW